MNFIDSLGRLIVSVICVVVLLYIRFEYFVNKGIYITQSEIIFYALSAFLLVWVLEPLTQISEKHIYYYNRPENGIQ